MMRMLSQSLVGFCCGVLAAGCPEGSPKAPPGLCEKAYEKCSLSSGALGVCDVAVCPDGKAPPCLVCRSQH